MGRMRWSRLVPPVLAAVAFAIAAASGPTAAGAADPPWVAPPCDGSASARVASERATGASAGGSVGRVAGRLATPGVPWFRVDPVLDRRGTLTARRVAAGDAAAGSRQRFDLAPESFVAGPFGRVLLIGSDDGQVSRLRLVDPIAGCAMDVAVARDVVRSGLLTPDGSATVEHRVDRRTRADLGVWQRSLAGAAERRIVAPLDVDAAYGPTFVTELAWGTDGRLVVMSCGELRCRARIVDPATGEGRVVGDVGPLVGLSGDRLVVHRACVGLPCPIEAVDVTTGRRATLEAGAGLATLADPARDRLVAESPDGTLVTARDLRTGGATELAHPPAGYALQLSASRSGAGIAMPDGWIALVPDGRVPLDVARGLVRFVDPASGRTATIAEVSR